MIFLIDKHKFTDYDLLTGNETASPGRGETNMKQSYRPPETDAEVLALAERIVNVILDSEVTFQKADDALSAAHDMLFKTCRPIND